MEISGKPERKASPTGAAVDIAVRLGVLAVLVAWCFQILKPFISPVIWGIIIAVAVYPAYEKLNAKLGDRRKLTAAVMTLAALLIIIGYPAGRFQRRHLKDSQHKTGGTGVEGTAAA